MIYICSVYSLNNASVELMQKRYEYVAMRTAVFMKNGDTVFSPINHCHPIAALYDMPRTWDFWKTHDLNYIDASEAVWVLMMPGWEDSIGITAEIEHALATGKPVSYVDCYGYVEQS